MDSDLNDKNYLDRRNLMCEFIDAEKMESLIA